MSTDAVTKLQVVPQDERPVTLPVLAVDLDGTLVRTDLLLESLLALVKQRPACIFKLPGWMLKGKAYVKQEIARRVSLDASTLPYREGFLDYLKTQRVEGRTIILATGSDRQIAQQVANHLKLFDLVLASDGTTNLSAEVKRNRLVREFGERGFDYAGNSRCDLPIWASARDAIVVNCRPRLRSRVENLVHVDRVFKDGKTRLFDYLKPLRLQHWVKNVLVFVPVLAAHRFNEIALITQDLLAFLAFGCFASAGYVMNDMLDLAADRHHPRKRHRSFAAGDLPLSYALSIIPILVGLGSFVGMLVSPIFLAAAWTYFGMSAIYSLHVKGIAVLDVTVLAGLYTLRIIAGSAAVIIWPSPWLLAFSTFLFFSLALVKRYSELTTNHGKARGYEFSDQVLLASMGIASGYVAILVLALYINTITAHILYQRYGLLWLLCPLLLYWISHIWLSAHRGTMSDDPLVFAASDPASRILITLMLTVTILAL